MFFILLTFAAALSIEGLGSLVSVIGISALFGANPIIIALAIALDVGKIVVVSLLYTHWKKLGFLMKSYALAAALVTMTITSGGAAGYLSGEFQKAIVGAKEGDLKVNVLKEQQARYQERKKQIDDQIANLPPRTTVTQRLRLINGFKAEQQRLDEQIAEIDKQLPQLQVSQIGTEAKVGPILQIAKAFNVPVEEAVKWVILAIIFVFDPLAIFLIIAGNFLWARRKKEQRKLDREEDEWYDDSPPKRVDVGQLTDVATSFDQDVKTEDKQPYVYDPKSMQEDFYFPPAKEDEVKPIAVGVGAVEEVAPPVPEPDILVKPAMEPPAKPEVPILDEETLRIEPEVVEVVKQSGLTSPVEVDDAPHVPVRSSLSDVEPDSTTVVDAKARQGYRRAVSKMNDL